MSDSVNPAPVMLSKIEADPLSLPQVLTARASASKHAPKMDLASTSSNLAKIEPKGFLGIAEARTWRPKLTVKNRDYPKVTCPGTFFIQHSGGFQLIHRASNKCLGFYTREQTKELERKYGNKKQKRGRHSKRS